MPLAQIPKGCAMPIKRLTPKTCPRCGATNMLFIDEDTRETCRLCGYKAALTVTQTTPVPEVRPVPDYPITYGLIYHGDMDPWARTYYESGLSYYAQKNIPSAIASFQRALESVPDFLDAHLWLGRLLDTADEKRHHFSEVLAVMPNHLEAIREMMLLQGSLTPAENERSLHADEPNIQRPQMPVLASVADADCPVCGGVVGRHGDHVICNHCGYTPQAQSGSYGMKSFTMELLKRRGKAIQWEVGERLLHCDSCGAETLLLPQTLTANCPFCGSRHVVENDALHSFVQPDGVVPFVLSEEDAHTRMDAALNSRVEKLKGFFINNRVADQRMTGVYLPFWFYDMTMSVSKTTEDRRTSLVRDVSASQAYRQETFQDGTFDVPVCGVESPPRRLTERLRRYDLGGVNAYHADVLAGANAQLYTIDFEKASLIARENVNEEMRLRHRHDPHGEPRTSVQSMIQTMQFRLVLCPVWVFTLTEQDGDVRLGLVHGQHGEVILGDARKKQ